MVSRPHYRGLMTTRRRSATPLLDIGIQLAAAWTVIGLVILAITTWDAYVAPVFR